MQRLDSLQREIDRCVRCGTCKSVCPTFKAIGRETAGARGKLTLVDAYLKGGIGLTENFKKHMKECTLCGACATSCPNGVDTKAVFYAARAEIAQRDGVGAAASMMFKNLLEPGLLAGVAMKAASRLQGLFFKESAAGLVSRFSLPYVGEGRLVPQLAKTFFLDLPQVRALGRRTDGARAAGAPVVAFYAGCGVNFLMPGVGEKSLDVLKKAGAQVVVPEGQICCGMPAFSAGDVESARAMALKNIETLEASGADFIVTSCATCGYALKKVFGELLGEDPSMKGRLDAFASKVRDISEFLVKDLGYKGAKGGAGGVDTVVTYHDPCHLGRAQGVREEPRELIAGAPGVRLKEMKNPCACCGLGGSLAFTNYGLSSEISARKAENVRKSGAEVVATACPGCMVQLRDGLHRAGVDAKVVHVVELL